MVLVEKPSSCTETVKLEYLPATSASCMHVLAGHPATTPCLLAIWSIDVSITEIAEDLNLRLSVLSALATDPA
jgi:hypothetical protein